MGVGSNHLDETEQGAVSGEGLMGESCVRLLPVLLLLAVGPPTWPQ